MWDLTFLSNFARIEGMMSYLQFHASFSVWLCYSLSLCCAEKFGEDDSTKDLFRSGHEAITQPKVNCVAKPRIDQEYMPPAETRVGDRRMLKSTDNSTGITWLRSTPYEAQPVAYPHYWNAVRDSHGSNVLKPGSHVFKPAVPVLPHNQLYQFRKLEMWQIAFIVFTHSECSTKKYN